MERKRQSEQRTRGGLVEEEDRRVGDHLHADAHPLPLSARDAALLGVADLGLLALLQAQLLDERVDLGLLVALGQWQLELRREPEGLARRQHRVHHIVLSTYTTIYQHTVIT